MQYSIINLSEVKENSDCLRIDSDFFRNDFLQIEKLLKKNIYRTLEEYGVKIYHPTEIKRNYVSKGIRFLRAQNVRPYFADLKSNPVYIEVGDAKRLGKNEIKKGDVLITRTGANYGQCCIYFKSDNPIASSHSFIIKSGQLEAEFLMVFLNSRYGRNLLNKGMYGAAQPEIAPFYIYNIPIPETSNNFQKKIKSLIENADQLIQNSKSLYQEAEKLLLEELGLKDWKPKHQLTYIKNYSDTQKAERFDAEYFQPKYDEVEFLLKNYFLGYSFIKDEFKHIKTTFKNDPNKRYSYIEIGSINVSNSEIIAENVLGKKLPANAKRKLSKNQIIISKVRTYRGAISIVDNKEYIGSGAFTVLEEKSDAKLNKETLLVLLKSKPLLSWSLKPNTGTSYPVIIDNDILTLPLPLISQKIQEQIKFNIEESNSMRKKSKELLELAKQAVEIAIEQDEETALELLKKLCLMN